MSAEAQAAHAGGEDGSRAYLEMSKMGMWLFLASEIMMFGAFIACYIVLRMAMPLEVVDWCKAQLSWKIACFNTVVLIVSSYTIVRAVNAVSKGNKRHAEDNEQCKAGCQNENGCGHSAACFSAAAAPNTARSTANRHMRPPATGART